MRQEAHGTLQGMCVARAEDRPCSIENVEEGQGIAVEGMDVECRDGSGRAVGDCSAKVREERGELFRGDGDGAGVEGEGRREFECREEGVGNVRAERGELGVEDRRPVGGVVCAADVVAVMVFFLIVCVIVVFWRNCGACRLGTSVCLHNSLLPPATSMRSNDIHSMFAD